VLGLLEVDHELDFVDSAYWSLAIKLGMGSLASRELGLGKVLPRPHGGRHMFLPELD